MGLIWLALAGIAVWALARLGRQTEGPRRGHWRVAATLLSAVLLAGGALAASRGAWLVLSSRIRQVAARPEAMSDAEARSVLGVGADATSEQIQAAWRRLMTRAHPDQGGSEGLASRLNAARDRLRKG